MYRAALWCPDRPIPAKSGAGEAHAVSTAYNIISRAFSFNIHLHLARIKSDSHFFKHFEFLQLQCLDKFRLHTESSQDDAYWHHYHHIIYTSNLDEGVVCDGDDTEKNDDEEAKEVSWSLAEPCCESPVKQMNMSTFDLTVTMSPEYCVYSSGPGSCSGSIITFSSSSKDFDRRARLFVGEFSPFSLNVTDFFFLRWPNLQKFGCGHNFKQTHRVREVKKKKEKKVLGLCRRAFHRVVVTTVHVRTRAHIEGQRTLEKRFGGLKEKNK